MMLNRYKNQIAKIQFGNEWNLEFWYAGTAQDFVAANNILYDLTKVGDLLHD